MQTSTDPSRTAVLQFAKQWRDGFPLSDAECSRLHAWVRSVLRDAIKAAPDGSIRRGRALRDLRIALGWSTDHAVVVLDLANEAGWREMAK